ncbi:hypothetical protein Taro_005351 [Colocasia esculenta]|uniref:Uncharacterized protein n=1 Tax=Colocasia esculenta TaxID=4460 RepID=A0A843TU93_COLES|nr:hypothetical protein [Colocasia esculenta]
MGVTGVRVQPARRPCGNPWTEETYGGLEQRLTSSEEGVSVGEFIQVKNGTTGSSTMWESMDRGDLRRP